MWFFHPGRCRIVVLPASSACALVDEAKKLVWASWWEGLAVGKIGSCSGGQGPAQQNFNLTVCWWVGLHSLSVNCLAWGTPGLESVGSVLGLRGISKRTHRRRTSHDCCCESPCPQGEPLLTHASKEGTSARAESLSVSVALLLFSRGPWCAEDLVSVFQQWSLYSPHCCESPIIKVCWPSKSGSLGIPNPFAGPPGWEACLGGSELSQK